MNTLPAGTCLELALFGRSYITKLVADRITNELVAEVKPPGHAHMYFSLAYCKRAAGSVGSFHTTNIGLTPFTNNTRKPL